jgi:hypothetical protein
MYDKQPYILTKNKIFYIFGSSSVDWIPKDMAAKTGTQSSKGALAVEGYGIFHVGSDGIYLYGPTSDYKQGRDEKITKVLDPIFRGESKNGIAAVGDLSNSWLAFYEDKVYFGYSGTEDAYPTNILVFYLSEKKVGYYTRGEEINAVAIDNYNNRLLACDNSGYVWEIECKTVMEDDGTAVEWEVQSKDFTLQTRRHFPRWVKYDINSSEAGTAYGGLLLDASKNLDLDQAHQVHTLSDNRDTRRRLVDAGNGRRCSLAAWGSGPIEIYAMESE